MTWEEIRDALTFELNPATTIADRCRGEQVKKELAREIIALGLIELYKKRWNEK